MCNWMKGRSWVAVSSSSAINSDGRSVVESTDRQILQQPTGDIWTSTCTDLLAIYILLMCGSTLHCEQGFKMGGLNRFKWGDDPPRPVSLAAALSCANRSIQDMPIEHLRTAQVYRNFNEAKERRKSRHARMPCSWPRSAAVTDWALRYIGMQQSTQFVVDAGKAHILWNTGSWNVLKLESTRLEIFGDANRRCRFLRINREKQCWCHGAPFRAAASVHQASVNNNSSSSSRTLVCAAVPRRT